jgi:hypothetical protein
MDRIGAPAPSRLGGVAMKSTNWTALGLALALACGLVSPAFASDPGTSTDTDTGTQVQETTGEQAGMGIAAFVATLFYSPVKIGYAALGGVTGGMGYLLTGGDTEVSTRVFTPSLRGTYVLSPRHLRGEESIHFVGATAYGSSDTADAGATDGGKGTNATASRGAGPIEEEEF